MSNLAKYFLSEGYLHHWLLAGPFQSTSGLEAKQLCQQTITQKRPIEMEWLTIEGEDRHWKYLTVKEDHWVDLTEFPGDEAWGYVEVHCPEVTSVKIIVTSFGTAELWVTGAQVIKIERNEPGSAPITTTLPVTLQSGKNQLVLRFTRGTNMPRLLAAAVQLLDCPNCITMLPVASPMLANRKDLEKAFEHAYLDRYVYTEKEPVILRWQKDYENRCKLAVQMRKSTASIIGYNPQITASAENELVLFQPFEVPDGSYNLRLMPSMAVSTENNLRIQRDIPLFSAKNTFYRASDDPIGPRVDEAVGWAIQRTDDFFGQAIKMAAKRWKLVNFAQIETLLDEGSHTPLLAAGVIGMLLRFAQDESFSAPLREKMTAYFQQFVDSYQPLPTTASEGDVICHETCRMLAAQMFGKQVFEKSKKTGGWHGKKASKNIQEWIQQRLAKGFCDWNDSTELEKILIALTLLVDFAADDGLKEYAGVLLDTLFFHLAIHQFHGVHGTARRHTALPQGLNSRFDPLAPVFRLMWGQGAPNIHLAGTAALLSVRSYAMPEIIRQIALDKSVCWMKERHADPRTGEEVNIATYKTQDTLLSSAQDYHPGQVGTTEHTWQATLSPDALVFTSHPIRFSLDTAGLPNFWCGDHTLPRVAQWKDTLFSIYQLPADDWAQFTHAYFPAHAFDEYEITTNWAFARVADGYLALTASQGMQWITTGDSALRELRSYGRDTVWLCRTGRQADDGSFAEFKEKVRSAAVDLTTQAASFHMEGSDLLEFGWKQPLRVNGELVRIDGFAHYDTPYALVEMSAPQMEIHFGEDALRLHFA